MHYHSCRFFADDGLLARQDDLRKLLDIAECQSINVLTYIIDNNNACSTLQLGGSCPGVCTAYLMTVSAWSVLAPAWYVLLCPCCCSSAIAEGWLSNTHQPVTN